MFHTLESQTKPPATQAAAHSPSRRTVRDGLDTAFTSTESGRAFVPASIQGPQGLAQLQRMCGNQAVLRMLSDSRPPQASTGSRATSAPLQSKLAVNEPGDEHEREADHVADTVMRTPGPFHREAPGAQSAGVPSLQRQCACGGSESMCGACQEEREVKLQRAPARNSSAGDAPPIVHEVLRSPGQPLDPQTRAFMEPRFGRDFSRVQIHADERAGQSALAVNARAYTVGDHIAFAPGEYAGSSESGRRLLAHELSHVVQQGHAAGHAALQRACGKEEIEKALPAECPVIIRVGKGGHRFRFNVNCDTFAPGEEARLRKFLNGVSSSSEISLFGMASSDGDPVLNEELACARANTAMQVIKDEHLEGSVKLWGEIGAEPGTAGNPDFRAVDITVKKGGPEIPSSEPDLKNVQLVVLPHPNVIRQSPDDPALKDKAIQVTLDGYMTAGGFADVVGGADCNKFTLGFFQICRPFDHRRAIYHDAKLNTDFEDDRSDQIRGQEPALDVHNPGDIWSEKSAVNCAAPGVLRTTEVLFTDKPSTAFLLKPTPDMFMKGMAWHDFFFTAFSVQRPDGSFLHLKSFYWDIHYCESFDPPTGSDPLGKSTMKKADVKIGGVMDGAPKEPGLNLAGTPAKTTCNQIIKSTKSNFRFGTFDITGSC